VVSENRNCDGAHPFNRIRKSKFQKRLFGDVDLHFVLEDLVIHVPIQLEEHGFIVRVEDTVTVEGGFQSSLGVLWICFDMERQLVKLETLVV